MIMSDETLTREILQRLTRIEENTKGINEATDKAERALSKAVKNEESILEVKSSIKEVKSNNRWAWGYMIGLGITIIGYFLTNILGGR